MSLLYTFRSALSKKLQKTLRTAKKDRELLAYPENDTRRDDLPDIQSQVAPATADKPTLQSCL